ncbi:hypothetical protein [Phenylobacterium sp.]|uniref:hypothetical protein n=1 Tax=Phenylobacterium sp. TaxID=1871053 RepID=UPI002FC7FD37
MSEIPYQAPTGKLAAACGVAAAGAAAILTLFVLPAERGVDLTGLGRVLGLTGMAFAAPEAAGSAEAAPQAVTAPTKATIAKATPLRSDEMTLTLPPHSGVEAKAQMAAGDHMIFRWEATGPVKADMHGEPPNAGDDEFTTYWKEADLTSGQGAFTAQFAGIHGWYWRNRGETPVTVKVQTHGFYKALIRPATD